MQKLYVTFQYGDNDHLRHPRQQEDHPFHQEDYYSSHDQPHQYTAPSEAVPIILPFPGTEPNIRTGL